MRAALFALLALAALLAAGVLLGRHEPIALVPVAEQAHGVPLRSLRVETTPGVRLHVVEAGPADGPLVLLLHGFPELWWTWHEQIAALAGAGFRVRAPDLRGFHESDKPGPVEAYHPDEIERDLVALIEDAGERSAFIGAHDFGAVATWNLAIHQPERVRRMVVFNVSHPLGWVPAEERGEEQVNWFRVFFQLPVLPELLGPFGDWWLMARYLRDSSQPGTFDEPVMSYYRQAWARPGAFGAMIDWYRALFRQPQTFDPEHRVEIPTRIVFGENDIFNEPASGERSLRYCTQCEFISFPEAGHWILHEEPEATSRLMIELFSG